MKLSWQILATAALMAAGTANAQTVIWNGSDGAWFEPTNWDTSVVPQSGDAVYINVGTSTIGGLPDEDAAVSSLHLSGTGIDPAVLRVLAGASLTGNSAYLGEAGTEGHAYVSGEVTFNDFVLGNTGIGVLNLEPGGVVTVGSGGTGTLVLGENAGSKGYLNINDGTINASAIEGRGGDEQNVTFFQTGNYTLTASLTGNLSVFQNGAEGSVTTLAGSNTHTGGTTVVSGTLVIESNLTNSHAVVLGGTFLVKAGVSVTHAVRLAGGTYAKEVLAGDVTNAINVQSDLGGVPTTAVLLDGELSENATLQSSFAATSLAENDEIRLSDVFSFSGVPEGDVFVLQLEIAGLPENAILGWLNADNEWENAVLGNIGGTVVFVNGAYNPSEHDEVGTYGRDGNKVWAVLNHNSEFSVIPEPSSVALLAGGLVFLLRRRQS